MNKLKKNREYQKIYNNGIKKYGSHSLIFFSKNQENINKFGFVASKKAGNAVTRNRIKRLFREYIRLNQNKIKTSYDIIIVSKKNMDKNIKYEIIKKDLDKIFISAKLIKNINIKD